MMTQMANNKNFHHKAEGQTLQNKQAKHAHNSNTNVSQSLNLGYGMTSNHVEQDTTKRGRSSPHVNNSINNLNVSKIMKPREQVRDLLAYQGPQPDKYESKKVLKTEGS